MSPLDKALQDVKAQFPGAELQDVRSSSDEPAAERGEAPRQLPPIGETTFGKMKAAAAAEATRIEIAQVQLLESGRINQPSETQVQLRDAFDGIYRLIELIEKNRTVLREIVRIKNASGAK